MNKAILKSLRRQKKNFENLSEMAALIHKSPVTLKQNRYMENLLHTNQRLLKDFKIDNIIVF